LFEEPSAITESVIALAATIAALFAFLVVYSLFKKENSRTNKILKTTFILFCMAMIFYAAGEWTWLIYHKMLGIDPYPSLADLFYLPGYLFEIAAFIYLTVKLFSSSKIIGKGILFLTIGTFIITGMTFSILAFLIIPYQDWNSSLESLLNIIYPVSSAVILISSIPVYLMFHKQAISRPILLLAVSALLNYIGDLLFSYYSWKEIYGVIGMLSDSAYILGYVCFAAALMIFYLSLKKTAGIDEEI